MSRKKSQAELLNDILFMNNYNQLKVMTLNRFEWEGLPSMLEGRHIERALFSHGQCIFFNHKDYGLVALPCTATSEMNIYGDFRTFQAYGWGGQTLFESVDLDEQQGVLIKNNDLFIPTESYINVFAQRITEIERSIDINVRGQRTPYVWSVDDKTLLSIKAMYKKVADGEEALFVDKGLNMKDTMVHLTPSPFVSNDLMDLKKGIYNEFLTFIGFNNSNVDKKERLLTDEVNANNELIDGSINIMLSCRQQACDEINKIFGTNISVKLRGEEDEPIYNNSKTDDRE